MARIWIFIFLLIGTSATSLRKEETNTTDYDYEDDYYDDLEPVDKVDSSTIAPEAIKQVQKEVTTNNPKPVKERDREELTTKKPFAKYEVTEFVDDAPDVTTKRVPILTNFTITRPLNLAGTASNKIDTATNVEDEGDEIFNTIFVPDKPKEITKPDKNVQDRIDRKFDVDKYEKNYFDDDKYKKNHFDDDDDKNIFDKEFSDKGSDDDNFEDFDKNVKPKTKSFRDFFHNARKSIVSGFNGVINKHRDGINDSLHKIVHAPISFFSLLHKTSSDLAKKIHRAISRHKPHDDVDNDDEYFNEYHDFHSDESDYDYK